MSCTSRRTWAFRLCSRLSRPYSNGIFNFFEMDLWQRLDQSCVLGTLKSHGSSWFAAFWCLFPGVVAEAPPPRWRPRLVRWTVMEWWRCFRLCWFCATWSIEVVVAAAWLKMWDKADQPSFKEVTWNDVSMGFEGRVCGLGLLFWSLTRRVTRFDCEFPEVPFGSKDADLRNFLVGRNLELGKIELGSHPCSSILQKNGSSSHNYAGCSASNRRINRPVAVALAANCQDLWKMSKTMGYASSPSFGCKDVWMQIRPWSGMVWLDRMFISGLTASESSSHSFKLMDGNFDLFSLIFRLCDIFRLLV